MHKRTRLLAEFGPYGPGLSGITGFAVPLSIGRFSTFPYQLDPQREKERFEAVVRRRNRLRELTVDWMKPGQMIAPDTVAADNRQSKSAKKSKKLKSA